jgi:hypothetical protein
LGDKPTSWSTKIITSSFNDLTRPSLGPGLSEISSVRKAVRKGGGKRGTDELLASITALRSTPVDNFLNDRPYSWPITITSINEDTLLAEMGLSAEDRKEVEGLQPPRSVLGRRGSAAMNLAYDAPIEVNKLQRLAATRLLRAYPLGLRFSGANPTPLPAWLAGAQYVALNMCNVDLAVQVRRVAISLFRISSGSVAQTHSARVLTRPARARVPA